MLTENQLKRNVRAYYMSRIDMLSLIVVAIIQIWLIHGMNLARILVLQGIFGLFVLLLEFPSGVWADLTSRKNLLVCGNLAIVAGTATYMMADNFGLFVLAELFYAIGMAMNSGANSAHLYDSYLMVGNKEQGDEILANGSILTMGAMIILASLGGWLYTINHYLPFILAILGNLLEAFLYLLSTEPSRVKVETSSKAIKQAFSELQNSSMLQLLVIFLFGAVYLKTAFWAYVPKLEKQGIGELYHGFVLSGANIIAFSSSLLIKKKYKSNMSFIPLLIIGLIGLGLFAFNSSLLLLLLAIGMHQMVRGGFNLLLSVKINQQVSSEVRASLISLISSIGFGIYFLLSLVFEYLNLALDSILVVNALIATVSAIIYWVFWQKTKLRTLSYEHGTTGYQEQIESIEVLESIPVAAD